VGGSNESHESEKVLINLEQALQLLSKCSVQLGIPSHALHMNETLHVGTCQAG
jgi:hypothetical protein